MGGLGAGILVEWTDNSDDEDGFRIYYGTDGVTFPNTVEVGPNVTRKRIGHLVNGQTYYFYVVAFNGAGESDPTDVESAVAGTDVTAPTLVSATVGVDGVSFTEVYSEAVEAGADGFVTGFTINTDGAPVTKTYVSGAGTTTIVYSLDDTVLDVDTLTLDYTQPGDGIKDAAGNLLASFSGAAVTNDSGQTGFTYIVNEGFEGAGEPANFSTLPGANPPDWDYAATPLVGSQSVLCEAGDEAFVFGDDTPINLGEIWGRIAVEFSSVTGQRILSLYNSSNAEIVYIYRQVGGGILISAGGSTALTLEATPDDTLIYIWYHYAKGGGSNAAIEVWFSTTTTKPADGSGFHAKEIDGAATTNVDHIVCRPLGMQTIYDDFKVAAMEFE